MTGGYIAEHFNELWYDGGCSRLKSLKSCYRVSAHDVVIITQNGNYVFGQVCTRWPNLADSAEHNTPNKRIDIAQQSR
jgi:hypothetical protein